MACSITHRQVRTAADTLSVAGSQATHEETGWCFSCLTVPFAWNVLPSHEALEIEAKLQALFREYDTNADGVVTVEEFVSAQAVLTARRF